MALFVTRETKGSAGRLNPINAVLFAFVCPSHSLLCSNSFLLPCAEEEEEEEEACCQHLISAVNVSFLSDSVL